MPVCISRAADVLASPLHFGVFATPLRSGKFPGRVMAMERLDRTAPCGMLQKPRCKHFGGHIHQAGDLSVSKEAKL